MLHQYYKMAQGECHWLSLDIATKYNQGKIMEIILNDKIGPHAAVHEEIHLSFFSTNVKLLCCLCNYYVVLLK